MRPDTVMIFAAGHGTRMGDLTRACPKPLLRLGGETLIDRTIGLARAAGLRRMFANAHYLGDMIEAHLAGSGVTVLREDPDILDTGGGLKAALPQTGTGQVFTANPDVAWFGPNPFAVLADLAPAWADATLLLVPLGSAEGHGVSGDFTLSPDGRLSRKGPMIFGGLQIIRAGIVADIPARVFSLNAVWDRLIASGSLTGVVYPGRWCDAGTPNGLARAETLVETGDGA